MSGPGHGGRVSSHPVRPAAAAPIHLVPHSTPVPDTRINPRGTLIGQQLACRRGRRLLFTGLDFALLPGSVTWLRGANGTGKTSLMRLLAGLTTPESGRILWGGEPISDSSTQWHRHMIYVSHANALKEDLTLEESVSFLARLQGHDDAPAKAGRALDRLGLAHRRSALVRTLSQGQRRRGSLARLALDETPRAWILDEPYDALDTDGITRLDALVTEHAARGGVVLLTSHQAVTLPQAQTFLLPDPPPERGTRRGLPL
jgi:heme exporter protein A